MSEQQQRERAERAEADCKALLRAGEQLAERFSAVRSTELMRVHAEADVAAVQDWRAAADSIGGTE